TRSVDVLPRGTNEIRGPGPSAGAKAGRFGRSAREVQTGYCATGRRLARCRRLFAFAAGEGPCPSEKQRQRLSCRNKLHGLGRRAGGVWRAPGKEGRPNRARRGTGVSRAQRRPRARRRDAGNHPLQLRREAGRSETAPCGKFPHQRAAAAGQKTDTPPRWRLTGTGKPRDFELCADDGKLPQWLIALFWWESFRKPLCSIRETRFPGFARPVICVLNLTPTAVGSARMASRRLGECGY